MSLEIPKTEIKKDDYVSTAAGALVGGAGAYGVINGRIKHFAKKTVQALNKSPEECDVFVKKHDGLLTKASISNKGFFGKINKLINGAKVNEDNLAKVAKNTTKKVVDGYTEKAAKKLGNSAVEENVKTLKDKLISKDIAKSIKSATKFENILKISGAVVVGAIGLTVIKDIIQKSASNRLINKTTKEIEKEEAQKKESPVKNDNKKDIKEKVLLEEKIEAAEEKAETSEEKDVQDEENIASDEAIEADNVDSKDGSIEE